MAEAPKSKGKSTAKAQASRGKKASSGGNKPQKSASGAKKSAGAPGARGPTLAGRTMIATRASVPQKWVMVDLTGLPVGRAAARISQLLRGKTTAQFHPSQDVGCSVVALNATKLKFSGNKMLQKIYYRHSGYLGHLRRTTARDLMEKFPDRILRLAVKGMMPPTNLARRQLAKLFIYGDANHPHQIQNPESVQLTASQS